MQRPRRGAAVGAAIVALVLAGCRSTPAPPSFVLVVLDTTRGDAVSAYGEVADTTPTVDRLAREGLLYTHAYSNANWTLPSHASLFTGLLPAESGVRGGADRLGDVRTLPELLKPHGYETFAVSENPWLSPATELARRFDRYVAAKPDLVSAVRDWAKTRDESRPFFLFLNIMDSHGPYRVREDNHYLPAGVSKAEAAAVPQAFSHYICRADATDRDLQVLHGLYLGNVQAADAKVASVLEVIDAQRRRGPVIVIVTSDHGEYFGEQRLVEHRVGLGNAVLHVPLIVHGVPGVAPARIETPVQLVDLAPSILQWAGIAIPDAFYGEPLPVAGPAPPRRRPIAAFYYDYMKNDPTVPAAVRELDGRNFANCGPSDRVFDDMRTIIRFPYKLVWYAQYSPQLFDLAADPGEERDVLAERPELASTLGAELQGIAAPSAPPPTAVKAPLDDAQIERLRALGYLGGPAQPDATPVAPQDMR